MPMHDKNELFLQGITVAITLSPVFKSPSNLASI